MSREDDLAVGQKEFSALATQHAQLEQVVVGLMNGYAELSVLVEGLLSHVLEPVDEAQRNEFYLGIKAARKEMFDMMRKAANDMATSMPFDAAAMANMADLGGDDLDRIIKDSGTTPTP